MIQQNRFSCQDHLSFSLHPRVLKTNKIKLCCYLNIFSFSKIFGPFPLIFWLQVMMKYLPVSKRHFFFPFPAGLFWQGLYHKAPRRRREDHPAQGTHAGTGTIFQVQKNIATLSGFISSQYKHQIKLIHSEAKIFGTGDLNTFKQKTRGRWARRLWQVIHFMGCEVKLSWKYINFVFSIYYPTDILLCFKPAIHFWHFELCLPSKFQR